MASIVSTAGGASSNSYCSLAEAEAYFEGRLYKSAWDDADDDEGKIPALIWATRILETRVRWNGTKATAAQALQWPRGYVVNPYYGDMVVPTPSMQADYSQVLYISDADIPQFIKDAECEMALALLGGTDVTLDPTTAAYNSISVGPISLNINDSPRAITLPKPVRELVRPYGMILEVGSGIQTAQLLRT